MKTMQTRPFSGFSNILRMSLFSLIITIGLTGCDSSISGVEVDGDNDILAVASTSDFNTLTLAIEAAELTGTLKGDGPFTVFAPTDDAFAKLPESAINTLLKPENRSQLAAVLSFHVVPGRVYANEITQLVTTKTLTESALSFTEREGDVYVNEARIVSTDIEASNGIVHVIDTVLLPDWFGEWISRTDTGIDPIDDVYDYEQETLY